VWESVLLSHFAVLTLFIRELEFPNIVWCGSPGFHLRRKNSTDKGGALTTVPAPTRMKRPLISLFERCWFAFDVWNEENFRQDKE
jgi:hypothetical protein